ncbi:MAG: hypothetical protein MUE42_03390 [Opitutaceae bacterium]|nr:hypothetical protein [Opitutaceae bacterium]
MENQLEADRQARLAHLPAQFGYPDLGSFVRALRAAHAAPAKSPKSPRRRPRPATAPRKSSPVAAPPVAATVPPATTPSHPSTPVAVAPAAISLRPSGTSLDDPANFGLMPDRSVLDSAGAPLALYRERMSEALRFATRVLHTSKVPAAVWREWRQFERQLTEALRATLPQNDPDAVAL